MSILVEYNAQTEKFEVRGSNIKAFFSPDSGKIISTLDLIGSRNFILEISGMHTSSKGDNSTLGFLRSKITLRTVVLKMAMIEIFDSALRTLKNIKL
jgi:hypothetical protein